MIRLANKTVTKARGVALPGDMVYAGTSLPVWNGGFSNLFSYKNFNLNVNMIYNLGHVEFRDVNSYYTNRLVGINFSSGNAPQEFANRWKAKGDELVTNIPSFVAGTTSVSRRDVAYYQSGDINVIDASYIKLRDITLNYNLPASIIRKLKASNISLRCQLSNIMLWKANKYGIDPEFQSTGSLGLRNVRTGQHEITLGAHITL
jgi:hypothetical protein